MVIIGAGVIGLSIAWKLSREGATVAVVDKGLVGQGASWAAAGMLAPFAEAKDGGPFAKITLEGLRAYPEFIDALEEETGLETELSKVGLLRVALNEAEEKDLAGSFSRQCADGLPVHWLTADEARKLEPGLSTKVRAAILSPQEWHIEPRRLTRALAVACAARGVRIEQETTVTGFEKAGEKVTAVRVPGGTVEAGKVVVAGGAWSEAIGQMLDTTLPVFPVRGQIVSLGPCLPSPVRHTIYAHCGYLVPKADGRVLVGATEENAGFNTRTTCGGVGKLLGMAPDLAPALSGMPIESTWAGLRPATPDKCPILGRLTGWQNVLAATGHFRNGILLAPITAQIMSDMILHDRVSPLAAEFAPERFEGYSGPLKLEGGH